MHKNHKKLRISDPQKYNPKNPVCLLYSENFTLWKLHMYCISFKTTPECYIFQSVQNISDILTGLLDESKITN